MIETLEQKGQRDLLEIGGVEIPAGVFPVPVGSITYEDAANIIFPVIAETKRVFMRDMQLCEVIEKEIDGATLNPLEPERFVALLDGFGHQVKRREQPKSDELAFVWRKCNFPINHAKTLFQTDAARNTLPKISRILSAPIIVEGADGYSSILQKGYHPHGGGTLITKGAEIPVIPLGDAIEKLKSLLDDFNFSTPSDKSRAMASFISPALKFGDLLPFDYPIDFAEADQSQSGKTYRQKIVCAIYNENPSVITEPKGGVGSLDESISGALIKGKPFLTIDNLRSKLDSTILETATRGHGTVQARALRTSTTIETRHYLWQISTNGAELTRDAANRCVVTKITKRPASARYKTFPEGDLLQHVKANQHIYLGSVFAIVREWMSHGKPRSGENRHDFREWAQTLDWIITEIMGMPPLMDGHREEQLRTANPALQWLRAIALAAVKARAGEEFSASQIVELGEEEGIDLPCRDGNRDKPHFIVGRVMGKLFTEAGVGSITVEQITVTRTEREILNEFGNWKPTRFYHFTRKN
jgi:hypothetical protein